MLLFRLIIKPVDKNQLVEEECGTNISGTSLNALI